MIKPYSQMPRRQAQLPRCALHDAHRPTSKTFASLMKMQKGSHVARNNRFPALLPAGPYMWAARAPDAHLGVLVL